MIKSFRGHNSKDVETAAESLVYNVQFASNLPNKSGKKSSQDITLQLINNDNIDNFIEKK